MVVLYVAAGAAAGASFREYGDRLGMAGYGLLGLLLAAGLLARVIRRRHSGEDGEPPLPMEPERHPAPASSLAE